MTPSLSPKTHKSLLAIGESQRVEFKEDISDALAREMVAMSNTEGGRVLIGVADDGQAVGASATNNAIATVQDYARNCDPAIQVKVRKMRVGRKDVLVIDVPEGDRKPYACKDGYFLRVGPASQKLRRDELLDFIRRVQPYCIDEMSCPEFKYPRDFDSSAFKRFLERARISKAGLGTVDLLKNMGVIAKSKGGRVVFNNAGVLFFAKQPLQFIPHAEVTCVLFQSSDKADILDRKDMQGTLPENVEQAMIFLKRHLSLRYEIKTLQRKEILELPEEALREAVLNAVVHRDYAMRGARVMVEIFLDRVEISDPGGLPPGMKLSDLGKRAVHRNPRLVDLFHRIDEIEKVGSGIGRMRKAARAARVPSPKFEVSGFFAVSFKRRSAPETVHAGWRGDKEDRRYGSGTCIN